MKLKECLVLKKVYTFFRTRQSKLKKEGSELSEKIGQLKMQAEDGKMRITDIADTEQLFRLIQSVPSSALNKTPTPCFL